MEHRTEYNQGYEEEPRVFKYFLDCKNCGGEIEQISEDQLKEYFGRYGIVSRLNIVLERGMGYMDITSRNGNDALASQVAIAVHEIGGIPISVAKSRSKKKVSKRLQNRGGYEQPQSGGWGAPHGGYGRGEYEQPQNGRWGAPHGGYGPPQGGHEDYGPPDHGGYGNSWNSGGRGRGRKRRRQW